jgi:hypothetical protein
MSAPQVDWSRERLEISLAREAALADCSAGQFRCKRHSQQEFRQAQEGNPCRSKSCVRDNNGYQQKSNN